MGRLDKIDGCNRFGVLVDVQCAFLSQEILLQFLLLTPLIKVAHDTYSTRGLLLSLLMLGIFSDRSIPAKEEDTERRERRNNEKMVGKNSTTIALHSQGARTEIGSISAVEIRQVK